MRLNMLWQIFANVVSVEVDSSVLRDMHRENTMSGYAGGGYTVKMIINVI